MTQTVARPQTRKTHEILVARHSDTYALWRREEALVSAVRRNMDEGPGDEVDHAMMRAQLDEQVMLSASLHAQLDDLELAIQRSEAGTYGLCARCGEPIPDERLSLFPATTHCVACKSWMERH